MLNLANSTLTRPSARLHTPAESEPARHRRLNILILRVRLLSPLNTGNRIRSAKMIEQLSKYNEVSVVSYRFSTDTDEDVRQTREYCRRLEVVPHTEAPKRSLRFYYELALNLFGPRPYIISKYVSRAMSETVRRVYQEERPDLVLCDYLQPCESLRALPGVPFVLFEHNVEAAIFEQLAERAGSFWARAYLRMQARRLRIYEKARCRQAAHVIAVSEVDRAAYGKDYGVQHCSVIAPGVDIRHFQPAAACQANNLVFVGAMDWLANQDAVKYFVAEIFPLIRRQAPDAVFTIVGRNAPPEISKLGATPGVRVTGTVADIRPYVHAAKVFVVPLRIGSGTRLKLPEALALGKAIVSTALGAEGLPLENGRHIIIADQPRAFADAAIRLLRDDGRRAILGAQARALAEENYSWEKIGRDFNAICQNAAANLRAHSL